MESIEVYRTILNGKIIRFPLPVENDFDTLRRKTIVETEGFLSAFFSQYYTNDVKVKQTATLTYHVEGENLSQKNAIIVMNIDDTLDPFKDRTEGDYQRWTIRKGSSIFIFDIRFNKKFSIYKRSNAFHVHLAKLKYFACYGFLIILAFAIMCFLFTSFFLEEAKSIIYVIISGIFLVFLVPLTLAALIDIPLCSAKVTDQHARLFRNINDFLEAPLSRNN